MRFSQLKKYLFFIIKLAIAALIVWYLLLRDTASLAGSLKHFDLRFLAGAALCYAVHYAVCAWRWRSLAAILNIRLGIFESFSLTMQGMFFSLVIPGGAIGGDVVKMAVISRRTVEGRKTEGAFTVLMDRIIGMIALFLLVLAVVACSTGLLMNCASPQIQLSDAVKKLGICVIVLTALSGLAASCVIFFHKLVHKVPLFDRLLGFADRISGSTVSRMENASDVYAGSPGKLTLLTAVSIAGVHLMTVCPLLFLLSGLGVQYQVLTVITAVTLGNVAGLLPFSPSGVGIRDLVTVTILVAGGVPEFDAKSAQLIYTAIIIFFNLLGGLFFVFDPGRKTNENNGAVKSDV